MLGNWDTGNVTIRNLTLDENLTGSGTLAVTNNLAWASGQAVAASLSGALAQATSDLVPYALLAVILLGTLAAAQRRASSGG